MGAKIYAEVTPHHLSLTEDDVPAHGTYARMNPPLRKEADRQRRVPDRHHRNQRCTRHRHCKVLEQCKFPFGAEHLVHLLR